MEAKGVLTMMQYLNERETYFNGNSVAGLA